MFAQPSPAPQSPKHPIPSAHSPNSPTLAPPPSSSSPPWQPAIGYALRLAVGAAVVFWFFLMASHVWRADSGLWHQGPDAPLGVFSFLAGDYTFSWNNTPPLFLLAAVLALGVYWGIGLLFLRLFDVYFTRLEETSLSLLFGAGLCGLTFEFLGMGGALTRWPILLLLAATAGVMALILRARCGRPLEAWSDSGRAALRYAILPLDEDVAIEDPRSRFDRQNKKREGWMSLLDSARFFIAMDPESGGRNMLRRVWRRGFANTLAPRESVIAQVAWALAVIPIAVLTLLTFYHAVFYPETYWDSLILYLGYGRMTFIEGGFPFKACAQVGIGLGANYPHLYSTHAAAVAAVAGAWSDLPARLFAPVAALAATALIYGAALRIWRNRLVAVVCALAFRALPYQIAYSTYASDYALALLFGAAMLFLAACYIDSPLPGVFVLLAAVPCFAMHLNYLMGVLWIVWAATILAAHWRRPKTALDAAGSGERSLAGEDAGEDEDSQGAPVGDPYYSQALRAPGVFGLLAKKRFWIVILLAVALSATWNVRNWWLTGNPVYAFFPNVFGGVRIDPEVLHAAEREWFQNGDGVGRLADSISDMETLSHPDDALTTLTPGAIFDPIGPATRTVADRLRASWMFWVGFDTFHYSGEGDRLIRGRWRDRLAHLLFDWRIPDSDRPLEFAGVWLEGDASTTPPRADVSHRDRRPSPLPGTAVLHWRHAYKLAPTTTGLALPGFLLWVVAIAGGGLHAWRTRRDAPGLRALDVRGRVGFVVAVFALLFLAYEYLIADLYLYQILPLIVATSLLAGWPAGVLIEWIGTRRRRIEFAGLFAVLYIILMLSSLVPGIAMALMGFKFTGVRKFANEYFSQSNLAALHHPGISQEDFWRLQYGDDVDAWDYINKHFLGQRLLTHENRHYVIDPSITLVHLDDWDIQKTYTMKDDGEKMALFRDLAIRYYYRIPNEENDPINRRVGLSEWEGTPLMTKVESWGDNTLYELHWSAVGLSDKTPKIVKPLESYIPMER